MDKVVSGLQGIRKIVDDVLVYSPMSALKKRVHDFLDRCSMHGVTLKRSKSQIAVREADFGGFHLSETGIQCSFELLTCIRDFPPPKNLTDLRSGITPAKTSTITTVWVQKWHLLYQCFEPKNVIVYASFHLNI